MEHRPWCAAECVTVLALWFMKSEVGLVAMLANARNSCVLDPAGDSGRPGTVSLVPAPTPTCLVM